MDAGVLRALERAGYECFAPLERKSCFDIAARSQSRVLLIKVLSNIDSLREEQARNILALASSLGATALLIGEKSKAYELEDGLVYERYGLQAITSGTLGRVLEGEMPDKTFSHGRVVARLDSQVFEQKLSDSDISDIAQRIHVTREAIYHYKKTLRMDYGKALELERMFNAPIIQDINLFAAQHAPAIDLHGYLRKMGKLGFDVIPVHRGFDAIAREKKAMLLVDETSPALARRKAGFMTRAGEFFGSEPVFVAKGKAPTSVKGVPVVTEKEINESESAGEVIDLVKKRKKEKGSTP